MAGFPQFKTKKGMCFMNDSRENFDEFFEKYKPIRNYDDRFTNCEIDGASYTWDTHEDWAMVNIADERHVWTLIETDKGEFIIQGRHFVDRLAYFICEVAYQEDITLPEADRVNQYCYHDEAYHVATTVQLDGMVFSDGSYDIDQLNSALELLGWDQWRHQRDWSKEIETLYKWRGIKVS